MIEFAQISAGFYLKSKNYSGYADVSFVLAQAYFSLNLYKESEDTCRQIIKVYDQHSMCFHIASVYSLLGLIYIRTKDFSRASALYKKSLHMEQYNERYLGAAIDYTNLACIEKNLGNLNDALYYLQSALENAKLHQNDELCEVIEQQLKKIKSFR